MPVDPTALTVTGPQSAAFGSPAVFVVSLYPAGSTYGGLGRAYPSSTAAGTFAPSGYQLLDGSNVSAAYSYVQAAPGPATITFTNNMGIANPAPFAFSVADARASWSANPASQAAPPYDSAAVAYDSAAVSYDAPVGVALEATPWTPQ